MKKIGEVFVFIICIFNLPGIISVGSEGFYTDNKKSIWITLGVLAFILSLFQINISSSVWLKKYFRIIRFYLFRTTTIALVILFQLLVVLVFITVKDGTDIKMFELTICLNLIAFTLLIVFKKISNSDPTEIIYHLQDGRIFLYRKNTLRYIPDPPTFNLLGFSWNDTIDITQEELNTYKQSTPITSIIHMQLLRYHGKVYGLVNDKLKYVPNEPTLAYIIQNGNKNSIIEIDIYNYTLDKSPFKEISY